jgi:chemotaxis protein CheX
MLQLQVTVQEPRVKEGSRCTYDVSGIIGLSGDVTGSVVLSFPTGSAERIVALFTGMELSADSDDFTDAVGELVNMVSGGAKSMFKDRSVSISCPSVVTGSEHRIASPKDVPCIVIPCDTDCGELAIEIMIDDRKSKTEAAAGAAAQA